MNPGTVTKLVSLNKNYSLIFLDDYCAKVEVFILRYSKALSPKNIANSPFCRLCFLEDISSHSVVATNWVAWKSSLQK